MPDGKPRGMKKRSRGSLRAKSGLPAKAGRRRPPPQPGPHRTTPEERAAGRELARIRRMMEDQDDG